MVKLFVGGFPLDIDELNLAMLIAPYGDIETLKIVRDKKTRVCKGYAFVEMKTREGADEVMFALHDSPMGKNKLSVKEVFESAISKSNDTGPVATYQKVSRDIKSEKVKRPRRPSS